jgi:hypothetical protein
MAKKKKVDPIKQREKRAKIAAGIGAVLLLGVAAIEVPSIMKQMNKKPAPVAAPAPAASSTGGALALPQVGATATGTTTTSSGLADTDVPPTASSTGQLVTFNAFEMKNPFKPQVSSVAVNPNPPDPTPTVVGGVETPAATTTATSTTPTQSTPLAILTGPRTAPTATTTTPTSTTPTTTTTTTTPAPATASTVAISVNGSVSRVGKAGAFPVGAPVFRLVSWDHGSAKIAIVGGSYATGGETLTLLLKQPVTLENTHDGKQYKLILESTP